MSADPNIEAMQREALAETSPESLGVTNYVLTTTFVRGNKDVGAYTYLLKLVIQHTLSLADAEADQDAEEAYLRAAIPMAYNLASNTWPGWGDEFAAGVERHHQNLGREAAELNIKLAARIGLGPERRKNGYWVLGAHLLAQEEYVAALEAFDESRKLANAAEDEASELMVTGYMHLTSLLRGEDRESEVAETVSKLREFGDDGAFYADQIVTAQGIFKG